MGSPFSFAKNSILFLEYYVIIKATDIVKTAAPQLKHYNIILRLKTIRGDIGLKGSSRLIFLILLILVGCGGLETKTIPDFYEKNLGDVSQITIFDGNTGYEKVVTDKSVIEDFLRNIEGIKFIPDENQEARDGFNYSITFFEGAKETFQFSLTKVGEHYYHTEPNSHPIVDDFYESLDRKGE